MLNIDLNLFFTLVGASVTLFLGTLVLFHNRRSATNAIFFAHSLVGAVWAVVNYFSVAAAGDEALLWIRLVIFLAVPHVFLFFLFTENFPSDRLAIPRRTYIAAVGLMLFMMALALSPWVFADIEYAADGGPLPVPGPLVALFSPVLVLTVLLTFWKVIGKYRRASELVRKQWLSISCGLVFAYALLISLVFLQVIAFSNTEFVLYSPLFILPIFAGAAYAILRHQLFNMKVIEAEILTFFLLLASFLEVLVSESLVGRIVGLSVSVFILFFGALLIRSVLNEVREREELQILTGELQAANRKLEELSTFKTQLLSLASHQIRAPLGAIKGFVTLLSDGMYGEISPKQKETLVKVKNSADDLMSLINSLLDLRKVDEGKMQYEMKPVDLTVLVRDSVEELRPLADAKGLELEFAAPAGDVLVHADGEKLEQVLRNLIDNAIKYTPQGFVRAELRRLGDEVIFAVSDSGLGIAKDVIPHLFEEFVRDERVKLKIRGTGLGLYIAKSIVEAHGGKIWAESEGEGKGSRFCMSLQMLKAPVSARTAGTPAGV